jgi:acetyl esterase/lipase
MKYAINKEFFPLYYFSAPAVHPKIAGFFGSLLKPPRKIFHDKEIDFKVEEIDGYEGGKIKIYVMSPKNAAENMPCIVYYHGGGFVYGASENHYYLCKEYALRANCKIVFVDYRLAPKYQFPIPAEDCYSAYLWTIDNAERLGIDKKRIAIGGDSAGGNLTSAVALMLRDRNQPAPLFQMLIYPVTDRRMITESMKNFVDTPMWNGRLSVKMWEGYLGKKEHEHIEYASPVEAPSLENLPDTYMETAEFDCLRDEGIMYGEMLEKAGVEVEFYHTKGTMHAFDGVRKAPTTEKAIVKRLEYITSKFAK